jgi:hypothetical protein
MLWLSLAFIFLVSAGFLTLSRFQARDIKLRVFESQVENAAGGVRMRFDSFLAPIRDQLDIARRWGTKGLLDIADPQGLNERFMPVLHQFPQIASLIIADRQGNEYFLMPDGDRWVTRSSRPAQWGKHSRWARWASATRALERWQEQIDYDPRQRPWYTGAMASADGQIYWTRPYELFTKQQPGITGAVRWRAPERAEADHVVAFDVLLGSVSDFTMDLAVPDAARVFILGEDGRLVGLPKDPMFASPKQVEAAMLKPLETLPLPAPKAALAAWHAQGQPASKPFRFLLGNPGRRWWSQFQPIRLGERTFQLAYITPESEIDRQLGVEGNLFVWTVLGFSGLALVAMFFALRWYRQADSAWLAHLTRGRIGAGGKPEEAAREVVELIRAGESTHLEFKSTLRWNLNSGKAGKEIELAWLKNVVAFLNSEGGTLLIGVDDKGAVTGIEPDRLANDDKYLLHVRNLLNQHIGAEFSRWVQFHLVPVEGRKVLVVKCRRAGHPAFLLHGGREEFYIRTGPAAVKLPPSKILKYLEGRKERPAAET